MHDIVAAMVVVSRYEDFSVYTLEIFIAPFSHDAVLVGKGQVFHACSLSPNACAVQQGLATTLLDEMELRSSVFLFGMFALPIRRYSRHILCRQSVLFRCGGILALRGVVCLPFLSMCAPKPTPSSPFALCLLPATRWTREAKLSSRLTGSKPIC